MTPTFCSPSLVEYTLAENITADLKAQPSIGSAKSPEPGSKKEDGEEEAGLQEEGGETSPATPATEGVQGVPFVVRFRLPLSPGFGPVDARRAGPNPTIRALQGGFVLCFHIFA